MTLDELGIFHETDKASMPRGHNYLAVYEKMFEDWSLASVRKVLEIGIAEGHSLRMWRDYFPEATIYGMDVDVANVFQDTRITCFLGDQRSRQDLFKVGQSTGGGIDLIIDDGCHDPNAQLCSILCLFPFLKSGGIYVIEDIWELPRVIDGLILYRPRIICTNRFHDSTLAIMVHP